MFKRENFYFSLLTFALMATFLYGNCSPKHPVVEIETASNEIWSCEDGLDDLTLFSQTYHQFLMNTCTACHSGGGPGPGAFASSGVQLAFNSFSALGFSRINSRALDGHNPNSGPMNASAIDSLMVRYVAGLQTIERCRSSGANELIENQDESNRLRTISRAINPSTNGPVTVTWDLGRDLVSSTNVNPTQFQNVRLSVNVGIFQRPGIFSYVISNPRLLVANSDVRIQSLLFKLNGKPSPAQRAFYFVDKGIRMGIDTLENQLISGGALVLLGEVRTTDVLSVSIGNLQNVTLPAPELAPQVQFGQTTMTVQENYQIVEIPLTLSKPWSNPTSAEIVFSTDTTVKDQCCRATFNDNAQPINVMHFDRDIQDFDTDPLLPINSRLNYEGANVRGRYLVTFAIGQVSKVVRLKIVHDHRDEANEVLHLRIDPTRLAGLAPASTNQEFRLTIIDNDDAYTGTAATLSILLNDGGILANECLRCHNSILNRGGYDITNYEQLVNKAILRPGDPGNSLMFLRMDADNIPGLDPMPLTGLIDPAQRFDVKQWILQGALNN